MEAGKIDPFNESESLIPLPTKQDGYATGLIAGQTGAGKTTLLRAVIGSNHTADRFPSTSTSRTTTADYEIITSKEDDYHAAITFMPEHEVRAHIDECIENACSQCVREGNDDTIANRLLHHQEQRFRLSYILGDRESTENLSENDYAFDDSDDLDQDSISDEETLTAGEMKNNRLKLEEYIQRIKNISHTAKQKLNNSEGLLQDTDKKEAWLEHFSNVIYEDEEFSRLSLDILDAIQERFNRVTTGKFKKGLSEEWPISWEFKLSNRKEFLKSVRWFSSNHNKQFGSLLTPLVNGVRVRGNFQTKLNDAPNYNFVLIDGEGVGHTEKSNTSISTRITRRYDSVDFILIVDNAEQPMQSSTLDMIKSVGASGHSKKLALAFTHFDKVKGENFGSFQQKKDHVMGAVRDVRGRLKLSLGTVIIESLESQIDNNTYFLGGLDKNVKKSPNGIQFELKKLFDDMQHSIQPAKPINVKPTYRTEGLEIAIRDAVEGFRQPWKARLGLTYRDGITKEHWTRVKALSRRFNSAWDTEYDTLRPVADFVAALQENISAWVDTPISWNREPTDEEKIIALDLFEAKFELLHITSDG